MAKETPKIESHEIFIEKINDPDKKVVVLPGVDHHFSQPGSLEKGIAILVDWIVERL